MRQYFRRYTRVLADGFIQRIKVLCTKDQLRRSTAMSLDGCIVAICDPPSLGPFTSKSSDSSAWLFAKTVMNFSTFFKMSRTYSLLLLAANCAFWASGRLMPLQLVANANLSASAFPVK